MLRAIKIRLYPNKEQELKLNKVLGCYRFVYNQMLALKQQEYNENKKADYTFSGETHRATLRSKLEKVMSKRSLQKIGAIIK